MTALILAGLFALALRTPPERRYPWWKTRERMERDERGLP